MIRQLVLSVASKSLIAPLSACRPMSSSNLKQEFEELKKRLAEEKPKTQKKTEDKEGRAKSMDELLRESREDVRKLEEERKQQFQEMKNQKTSLEFGDILNELKAKPKMYMDQTRRVMRNVGGKMGPAMAKLKELKNKIPVGGAAKSGKPQGKKPEVAAPKEEIRIEDIKEDEVVVESKPGVLSKTKLKVVMMADSVNKKTQTKFPKFHAKASSATKSFVELWHQTFPNQEDLVRARMERVKVEAKEQQALEEKIKTMSEEEIKKIQETIPEHRRKALAIHIEEQKTKTTGGIWSKIAETDAAKKLKESKDFKDYENMAKGVQDFTDALKEQLNESVNPTVSGARNAMGFFQSGSEVAAAITEMRKIDPAFDLFEMHDEVEIIFKQTYNEFLHGNKKYLEKVCGEVAMALFNAELKKRETMGYEPMMKELLFVGKPDLLVAKKQDKDMPIFIYAIQVQELFCNVSKKERKVVEGDPGYIRSSQFIVGIQRHSTPDLATTGHYWKIREIMQTGVFKQLV